jgi:hypothetical protein
MKHNVARVAACCEVQLVDQPAGTENVFLDFILSAYELVSRTRLLLAFLAAVVSIFTVSTYRVVRNNLAATSAVLHGAGAIHRYCHARRTEEKE